MTQREILLCVIFISYGLVLLVFSLSDESADRQDRSHIQASVYYRIPAGGSVDHLAAANVDRYVIGHSVTTL